MANDKKPRRTKVEASTKREGGFDATASTAQVDNRDEQTAEYVVAQFVELEDRLAQILRVVPLTDRNAQAYIPSAASIVVEAGTLVDSVLRDAVGHGDNRGGIDTYSPLAERRFGLSTLNTIVLQHPPLMVGPFSGWRNDDCTSYHPLPWWQRHTDAKHRRLERGPAITLRDATLAVAALQQCLAVHPQRYLRALWRRGLVHSDCHMPYVLGKVKIGALDSFELLIETQVFCTSVGTTPFPTDSTDIQPVVYGLNNGSRIAAFVTHPTAD